MIGRTKLTMFYLVRTVGLSASSVSPSIQYLPQHGYGIYRNTILYTEYKNTHTNTHTHTLAARYSVSAAAPRAARSAPLLASSASLSALPSFSSLAARLLSLCSRSHAAAYKQRRWRAQRTTGEQQQKGLAVSSRSFAHQDRGSYERP